MTRIRKLGLSAPGACRRRKGNAAGDAFERVVLNVSGEIYETYALTLLRYPESLLGDPEKRHQYYCLQSNQYFFNRNRLCFGAILYLYQSHGNLTCPPDITMDIFESECKFFQLPEDVINHMKEKEGLLTLTENVNRYKKQMPPWQFCFWNIVENPESSPAAKIFALISTAAILLSTFSASLKTLSYFDVVPWKTVDFALNSWFLFELVSRFMFSPTKVNFLKGKLNWIDALACVPFLFMSLFTEEENQKFIGFFRMLRVIRIIRLFRLSAHSKRLRIVGEIAKDCLEDLQMLLLCLIMLVIFYATIMFYVESSLNDSTHFDSIPKSLWWAIVTITTVGYGDICPVTLYGKILASAMMAFGASTLSLPVMSIVTKFLTIYIKNVESKTFSFGLGPVKKGM